MKDESAYRYQLDFVTQVLGHEPTQAQKNMIMALTQQGPGMNEVSEGKPVQEPVPATAQCVNPWCRQYINPAYPHVCPPKPKEA